MINIHLKIKAVKYEIARDFYSLSAREKINSVGIYETDFIMDRILNDMNLGEVGRFLINMFNLYSKDFKRVKSCEFYNGFVYSTFYFDSRPIIVSANNIAISLPSRLRKKYFIINPLDGKYSVNPDLYFDDEENGEAE